MEARMAFRIRGTPFDDVGPDALYGTKADDYITGEDGNDYIYGSAGSDQIDGGAQIDTVDYGLSPSGVRIKLSYALNHGLDLYLSAGQGGDAQGDTLLYVEKVYGSRYGDELTGDPYDNWLYGREGRDTLSGGDGSDYLDGGAHNDFLYGEGYDDTLRGGTGNDFIDGGEGRDTLELDTIGNTGVYIQLSYDTLSGWARVYYSNGDSDFVRGVENVVGTDYDDDIAGNDDRNTLNGVGGEDDLFGFGDSDLIYGGFGDDRLYGMEGNDSLFGGHDDDILNGGPGADQMWGDDGEDTAAYGGGYGPGSPNSGVIVSLLTGLGSGGDAGGDRLYNIENLEGTNYGDTLIGDGEDNTLIGWGGNDNIVGGIGDDTIWGDDMGISYPPYVMNFNDRLSGGDGYDVINGDGGDDFIEGGEADDVLTGGPGSDIFYYDLRPSYPGNFVGFHHDTITDWEVGRDEIRLGYAPKGTAAILSTDGADTVVTIQGAYGSIRVLNATPDEVSSGIDFFYV
jgi:Ca2+-binding RTX toxin-like protein